MGTEKRFVCIHGHFYQPPRENAWLEVVETQDSAYPYHDWNERISAECYAPNAAGRILDSENRIRTIVNNYSRISFNFGPTLLSWMEQQTPAVYEALLEADQESRKRFSGHGSALAQAYNHVIMPLAPPAQKEIQMSWGLQDFERRFRRKADGFWLPETAVDIASLEVLASHGIQFTVLAPHQAARVRKIGAQKWTEVKAETLDTRRPYLVRLPSGGTISLFFYDGPVAKGVAFEGLLRNGEDFAQRLLGRFAPTPEEPQLVHIATDGETYGHHHRYGEMALAYALSRIELGGEGRLTNYSEFLAMHPPTWEVEIHEYTAWSCAHGVERWRSDCGCSTGYNPGWNQKWRTGLREALNFLSAELRMVFETRCPDLLRDSRSALLDYISVISDRSPDNVEKFMARHAARSLSPAEQSEALALLEMLRHEALSFTSCAWFFDDLAGIETVQVLQYACRAIQLAEGVSGREVEEDFLKALESARSNHPERGTGRDIYIHSVKPSAVNLQQVAAHYALNGLFEGYREELEATSYRIRLLDHQIQKSGNARLAIGLIEVQSLVTLLHESLFFAAMRLGSHTVLAGVRPISDDEDVSALAAEFSPLLEEIDFAGLIRKFDQSFAQTYSLNSLFQDAQRRILRVILDDGLSQLEGQLVEIYERQAPLMRFIERLEQPLPQALARIAQSVLESRLSRALEEEPINFDTVSETLSEASRRRVTVDQAGVSYRVEKILDRIAEEAFAEPANLEAMRRLERGVELATSLPAAVNLWHLQNSYWRRLQEIESTPPTSADPEWETIFRRIGAQISFSLDALQQD